MANVETPQLQELSIAQLREYAKHLRVPLERTATKEEIIKVIDNKLNGRVMPQLATAGTKVPPGYARIKLQEDPTPGHQNLPIYINANGYEATIPRGVEVIVPMRVVRVLNDAVTKKKNQVVTEDNDTGRFSTRETVVEAQSFPFQLLESTPGPEVRTAHELNKLKIQRPREAYKRLFGRWPRAGDLTRAIEKGLIKLDSGDELDRAESDMLENSSK